MGSWVIVSGLGQRIAQRHGLQCWRGWERQHCGWRTAEKLKNFTTVQRTVLTRKAEGRVGAWTSGKKDGDDQFSFLAQCIKKHMWSTLGYVQRHFQRGGVTGRRETPTQGSWWHELGCSIREADRTAPPPPPDPPEQEQAALLQLSQHSRHSAFLTRRHQTLD